MNAKQIATFAISAFAVVAAAKYFSMADEEKEALGNRIKEKANRFKEDAKDCFEELKSEAAEALQTCWAEVEKTINDFFDKRKATTGEQTS